MSEVFGYNEVFYSDKMQKQKVSNSNVTAINSILEKAYMLDIPIAEVTNFKREDFLPNMFVRTNKGRIVPFKRVSSSFVYITLINQHNCLTIKVSMKNIEDISFEKTDLLRRGDFLTVQCSYFVGVCTFIRSFKKQGQVYLHVSKGGKSFVVEATTIKKIQTRRAKNNGIKNDYVKGGEMIE